MARVRALGWFLDGGLVGAVSWLIALSTLVAALMTGMLSGESDPALVLPTPEARSPLDFSFGLELRPQPRMEPMGIEFRKLGSEERIIVYR